MHDLFTNIKNSELRGFVIWLPMIASDNQNYANTEASELPADGRVRAWWNPDKTIGKAFSKTLGLRCTAWDVYLVYEPGRTWDGATPPKPDFWMHQLGKHSGAKQSLCLNSDRLKHFVANLFDKHEKVVANETKSINEFDLLKSRVLESGVSAQTSCNLLSTLGLAETTKVRRLESISPEKVKHVFNVLEDPAAKSSSILVRYGADGTYCFLISSAGKLEQAVRTRGKERLPLENEVATNLLDREYKFWQGQLLSPTGTQ